VPGGSTHPATVKTAAKPGAKPVAAAAAEIAANATAGPAATRLELGRSQWPALRRLYASYRQLPVADVGQAVPGSARAARVAGTEWAALEFAPSARASQRVALGFQDGAGSAIYSRQPGKDWGVAGLGMEPLGCGTALPARVRTLWGLVGCSGGSPRPRGTISPDSDTQQLADIAMDQIGIAANPADTRNLEDEDCNPFTAMEAPWTGGIGCGIDPTFHIRDQGEWWCADMAKWVWTQAGVTSDVGTLDPGANSFTSWGYAHGQSVTLDRNDPAVGDAVVFFKPGTTQNEVDIADPTKAAEADHVGIVVGVNPNGTVNLVNGDFWNGSNYWVEYDRNVSVGSWSGHIWAYGEKWAYVSPDLSGQDRVPAAAVDSHGNQYIFWRNSGMGLEEEFYTAASKKWSGPDAVKVDGNNMATMGSEPTLALGPQTANGYNYQYVFWESPSRTLYEAYWNGSWHGPHALGDGAMGSPPTAAADSSGTVDVFWENLSRGLEEISGNGTSFGGPHAIGVHGHSMSTMGSSPAVAVSPGGNQYVYWESPGGNLYGASWTSGNGWSGPSATGAVDLGGPPAVGVDSANQQHVFWESPGGSLYQDYWNGSGWSGSASVNGIGGMGSAPGVTVSSNGSQYVFWEGPGGDHDLYEASSVNGGAWTGATAVGGGVSMTG
jgi:hypothetical protein